MTLKGQGRDRKHLPWLMSQGTG